MLPKLPGWIQVQVIMEIPFDSATAKRPLPQNVACRRATLNDLPALRCFEHRRAEKTFRKWIHKGYILVVAERKGGGLVGFHCLSPEHVYPRLLGRAVPLAPTDLWGVDTYVAPECRGTGVFDHLKTTAYGLGRSSGYTRTVGSVAVRNLASRKSNVRIGAKAVGWLLFVRVGRRKLCIARRYALNESTSSLRIITKRKVFRIK